MEKEDKEVKKDIAKRLDLSNKKLWESLSQEDRDLIVNKYFDSLSIENLNLDRVLEDNRGLRRETGFLFMGIILGIIGGVISSIIMKHLPDTNCIDFVLLVACVVFIIYAWNSIGKLSADHLKSNRVLEYLIKSIKK